MTGFLLTPFPFESAASYVSFYVFMSSRDESGGIGIIQNRKKMLLGGGKRKRIDGAFRCIDRI
jgi:hypothetical protein